MKYDGVIARIKAVEIVEKDKFFLFLVDPSGEMHDGIIISVSGNFYGELTYEQLLVVSVIVKDGTMELESIELDDLLYGDKYPRDNIYYYIQNIKLYQIGKNKVQTKISDKLKSREFIDIASYCIRNAEKHLEKLKKS